jgi:hypothetical protein
MAIYTEIRTVPLYGNIVFRAVVQEIAVSGLYQEDVA